MRAQVAIVLQDSAGVIALADTIRANGHTVRPFNDPIEALSALERPNEIKLLVTSGRFPPGRPNGRSLALMALWRRPDIRVIFVCSPSDEKHFSDLGRCVHPPIEPIKLAKLAERLLTDSSAYASPNMGQLTTAA